MNRIKRNIPTVKIITLKGDVKVNGEIPIYIQYVQERRTYRLSLKKSVPPESWKGVPPEYILEKGPNSPPLAKKINGALFTLFNAAREVILDAEKTGETLTWQIFRKKLFDEEEPLSYQSAHVELMLHLRTQGVSAMTFKGYASRYRKFTSYKSNVYLHEINEKFVNEYAYWLRKRGDAVNTVYKNLHDLKAVMSYAQKMKIIPDNPIQDFPLKKEVSVMPSLAQNEVEKLIELYNSGTVDAPRANVLRQFLFACHTGLAYSDITMLDYKEINQHEGIIYIESSRQKNGQRFVTVIPPKALPFIKYPGEGKVFRSISNQKMNLYLKEVVAAAGITKKLTFHAARHTFGMSAINRGVRREIVQKMMGHAKSEMTDHYARLSITTILKEASEKL